MKLTRVTPRLYLSVTLIQATVLPPSLLILLLLPFRNSPHSSITYTHNQYTLSAVIDPCTVYTQLLRPDCGLLPGIMKPETDIWSPAPGSSHSSPEHIENWEIKEEWGLQRESIPTCEGIFAAAIVKSWPGIARWESDEDSAFHYQSTVMADLNVSGYEEMIAS